MLPTVTNLTPAAGGDKSPVGVSEEQSGCMSVKDTWTGKCELQDQPATRDPSNKHKNEKQALTESRASVFRVQGPLAPHSADMVWVALLPGGGRPAARGRGGEERREGTRFCKLQGTVWV